MAILATYRDNLSRRQDLLVQSNVHSLRQALRLLGHMEDAIYTQSPPGFAPHRVGGHLRHILEFYECFLDGIESRYIDYDARKRDESIEASRRVAMARIRAIIERLENTPAIGGDSVLWVRMEDSRDGLVSDPFLPSSPGRELQVLSSHTIHHFALIAMTLTAHGASVDRDFGMAPSTLRYAASKRTQHSTPEAA